MVHFLRLSEKRMHRRTRREMGEGEGEFSSFRKQLWQIMKQLDQKHDARVAIKHNTTGKNPPYTFYRSMKGWFEIFENKLNFGIFPGCAQNCENAF